MTRILETERKEANDRLSKQTKTYETAVRELYEKHEEEFADLTSRLNSVEHERDLLIQKQSSLESQLKDHQVQSLEDIDSLKLEKLSLEKELEQAVVENSNLMTQFSELRKGIEAQQSQEAEERAKIQSLMERLEANGAVVAEKQKNVEEKERVLNEAGADLEQRLRELLQLVSPKSSRCRSPFSIWFF